jgi:hypothetical protein
MKGFYKLFDKEMGHHECSGKNDDVHRYEVLETFARGNCKEHVNSLQIFYDEHKYYFVTKSFIHKRGNNTYGNLQIKITKYEPSCIHSGATGTTAQVYVYDYPKIRSDVCMSSSLISVI